MTLKIATEPPKHGNNPHWLHAVVRWIRGFQKPEWEYGTCTTESAMSSDDTHTRIARRNRKTGAVQFVLWAKGDKQCNYTYAEDYWHDYHKDWWEGFKPNPPNASNSATGDRGASPANADGKA